MSEHHNAAFPIPAGFEEGGLSKLEYIATQIYMAKLVRTAYDNNVDILIKQSISEAKKLLEECNK